MKQIRSVPALKELPVLADGSRRTPANTGDWAEGRIAFETRRNDFRLGVEGLQGGGGFGPRPGKTREEFVVSIGQREGGRKEGLRSVGGKRGER